MTYNVITIRTAEHDDPSFYPVLGIEPELIEFEAGDGGQIERLVATSFKVHELRDGKLVEMVSARDIKIQVYITDSRVALACEKWTKGGGWVGFGTGAITAAALNVASHARAALRRRGKLLVGQVRYQWVAKVGFTSKTDWKSSERLRIQVKDGTSGTARHVFLDLGFPKGVSAQQIATRVAQRAAHYRMNNDRSLEPTEREQLAALVQARPLAPTPGSFVFHTFPTFFTVNTKTVHAPHGNAAPEIEATLDAPDLPAPAADAPPALLAVETEVPPSAPVAEDAPAAAFACPNCGLVNREEARFCAGCGSEVHQHSAAPRDDPRCASCAAVLHKNARFCGVCGQSALTAS